MHKRFLLLVFVWAMSCTLALGDTLTIPNTFTAGTTIQSSQMNANFTAIGTWAAGNVANDNIKASAGIAPSKLGSTSAYPLLLLAAGTTGFSIGNTGDTQPRFAFDSDGKLKFGPGSATAIDTILKRSAVGKLAVRNAADAANADLDVATLTATTAVTAPTATGSTHVSTPLLKVTNGSALNIAAAAVGADRTITAVDPGATASMRFTTGTFNAGGLAWTDATNILSSAAGTTEQIAFSGGTGSPVFRTMNFAPGGRLTLTSGTPVTVSDVTAAGTIYYTPYLHKSAWLKVGSSWVLHQVAETSLALTLTSGSVYDVFMYSNAGTPTLETLVWTNTTTRATAVVQDSDTGHYIKSGDATRLYLGTIYATGSNQTEDSAARRMVWNMYNRVNRALYATDATNSWTYGTATWRGANGLTSASASGTTLKFDFVIGLAGESADVSYQVVATTSTLSTLQIGMAMDSTTTPDLMTRTTTPAATYVYGHALRKNYTPAIGFHYAAGMEIGDGTNTSTFYGDNGGTVPQATLVGRTKAALPRLNVVPFAHKGECVCKVA